MYAGTRDPYEQVAREAARALREIGRRLPSPGALSALVCDGIEARDYLVLVVSI